MEVIYQFFAKKKDLIILKAASEDAVFLLWEIVMCSIIYTLVYVQFVCAEVR